MHRGLVVVVSAALRPRDGLVRALEAEGFTVLALRDCGELLDLVEALAHRDGGRARGAVRLVVADATLPPGGVLEVAAWARLQGLDAPFLLFTSRDDARTLDLARAVGGVRVLPGSSLLHARAAVRAALEQG